MLTLDDCLAFCDLTEDEIKAVAEHENLPEIVALELSQYLVQAPDGVPRLKRMILDDLEAARARGDEAHVLKLRYVLHHFVQTHPQS